MTKERSTKRRVRERMSKTGESYTTSRRHVVDKRERVKAARSRLAAIDDRPTDDKIEEATGRKWDAWFGVLDRWDARRRKHAEIAAFLMREHGVSGWWAQTITVWYERARGMRLKHQQADGFSISASKTIAVPVDELFKAFADSRRRKRWLTDGAMRLRTSRTDRDARFDWNDGPTRVNVWFVDKGRSKATVAVEHERLPDADEAEAAKASWRRRLGELKSFLES
jgi:uncharacterized protein YndB with AHSA1/START domain